MRTVREIDSGAVTVWYVYFLHLRNADVYVGSTNNLRVRFETHAKGQVVAVVDEKNVRALERYFKSGSGKAFANKRFWPRLSATRPQGEIE